MPFTEKDFIRITTEIADILVEKVSFTEILDLKKKILRKALKLAVTQFDPPASTRKCTCCKGEILPHQGRWVFTRKVFCSKLCIFKWIDGECENGEVET
jgi:hypothetical protein